MTAAEEVAARIRAARAAGAPVPVDDGPRAAGQAEAYAVQRLLVADRLARGERVVGWKIGYASEVMRAQMGVSEPNLGPLTDAMLLGGGALLPRGGLLHPRVEPEVAVVLGADVAAGARLTAADVPVGEVRLALEVVDSVWAGYRFAIGDNTADSSSAAFAVVGPPLAAPGPGGWGGVEVVLEVDAAEAGSGRADAAMGDPLAAVAWLAGALEEAGYPRGLRAGDIVLTGGLTAAVPVPAGARVRAAAGGAEVLLQG